MKERFPQMPYSNRNEGCQAMDMKTDFVNWDIAERDAFGRLTGLTTTGGPETRAAIRPLLVATDGSPATLRVIHAAQRLAGDARVHVLNTQPVIGTSEGDDTLMHRGLAETRAVRAALAGSGQPYLLRLVAGMPADAILAHAREHGVAEIVIGADGAGGVAGALLGSVAMDVLAKTELPVTLVKSSACAPEFPAEWTDWLVACDGSAASLRALQHALAHLAGRDSGARLHLLNVRTPTGHFSDTPQVTDEAALTMLHNEAHTELASAFRLIEAAGIDYDCRIAIGDPVARILETAEDLGCGHIAMGTSGLGWLGGMVLGSISAGVLRRTSIPLTLVK